MDRSGWLVFFGVLQFLLGLGAGLMGLFMLLTPLIGRGQPGYDPATERFMFPVVAQFGVLALHFLAVGLGSIMARRWAWALSLIVSWLWLATGVIALACMGYLLPTILDSPDFGGGRVHAGVKVAVLVFTLLAAGFIYVLLPLLLMLFYRGQNVRRTIEARDPVECWTDRRPLPVTGMFLMLALGAWYCLTMLPVDYAFPLFGYLLTGPPVQALLMALAAVFALLAWGSLRQSPLAWWGTLGLILFWGVSAGITFAQVDLTEFYRATGYPEAQIEQMRSLFNTDSLNIPVLVAATTALGIVVLVWLRRYFGVLTSGGAR